MKITDLATTLEFETTSIDKARAVLAEASQYFDFKSEIDDLPRMATHILHLLHAVDDILYQYYETAKTLILPLVPDIPGAHGAVLRKLVDKIGI